MTKRYIIFLIFILLIHLNSKAQRNIVFLDITGGAGRLIPHYTEMEPLAGEVAFFNAKLGLKCRGIKEWQRLYHFPEIGVGLSHNYLTTNVLGNPTAVYSFMNLPLTGTGSMFKLNMGMHLGVAWGFNPYSALNPENLAIGSAVTAYASINLNTSLRLSDRFELIVSAGGYHYSNGNLKKPNKGINMPGAEAGLRYVLSKSASSLNRSPVSAVDKRSSIMIFATSGWKQENTFGPKYSIGSFSTGYYRTLNSRSRLSVGIDLFYDEGSLFFSNKANKLTNVLAYGVFGGHELQIDKLSIVTQLGIYLHNPHPIDPFYYERLGLRYTIAKRIIPSVSLKAHGLKIDFVEWGAGFVLWRSQKK